MDVSVPSGTDLRHAIAAGASYLAAVQDSRGAFPLTPLQTNSIDSVTDELFASAVVVELAASVLPPASLSATVEYILDRRGSDGFWSWAPDASLPPDADDLACCLGVLAKVGVVLNGDLEARRLRAFWRWRGPFRTWLGSGFWNRRDRDDPVVNCNVLWALRQIGADVRRRERRVIERMVRSHSGPTRYYCHEASVAWAAARAGVAFPQRPPPTSHLAGRPLETALWALADPPSPGPAVALLEMQDDDGGWAAEPWVQGEGAAWESRAVTTAFALAALERLAPGPPAS
jgi:hypothetical protein